MTQFLSYFGLSSAPAKTGIVFVSILYCISFTNRMLTRNRVSTQSDKSSPSSQSPTSRTRSAGERPCSSATSAYGESSLPS